MSHLACSGTPNITWVVTPWGKVQSAPQPPSAASVHCMHIHIFNKVVKSMNAKNTKKSQIHENADANITCDFGDVSRCRSRLPHGQTASHIVSSIIVRYCSFLNDVVRGIIAYSPMLYWIVCTCMFFTIIQYCFEELLCWVSCGRSGYEYKSIWLVLLNNVHEHAQPFKVHQMHAIM